MSRRSSRLLVRATAMTTIARAEESRTFPSSCMLKTITPMVSFPADQSRTDRVSSVMAGTAARNQPDTSADRIKGIVMSRNDRLSDAPDERAASSSEVWTWVKAAATGLTARVRKRAT